MHTFCFFFVKPDRVEGIATFSDEDERRTALLDLLEHDDIVAWSELRIRGPELDRTLATLERIFGIEPEQLSLPLLAGPFPGPTPQRVPYASYLDRATVKRWAERLTATPDQDTEIDEDEEVARVYADIIDAMQEAADRDLALLLDSVG